MPTRADDFLLRVVSILSASDDAGALRAFVEAASALVGGQCWLAAWDTDLATASWQPPIPATRTEPFPLRVAGERGSLLRKAVDQHQDIIIAEARETPESPERAYLVRAGGGWAFLPLRAAGRNVGCLVVRMNEGEAPEGSLRSLREALPVAAVFMRNGLLQRELESRVEERTVEISLLYDISRSLGFVLSPQDLFHLVGSSLRRALSFDMCALMLLLPDHREISVQLSAPAEDRAIRRLYRLATSEVERLGGQRPTRVPMTVGQSATGGEARRIRAIDLKSVAHAPLYIRGQVAGLLSVASHDPDALGESQLRLLFTIANQASLTLDRIRTAREAETSRMHSMLESMTEGVMLLDDELRIVMSNPAAAACLAALQGGRAPRRPRVLTKLGDVRMQSLLELFGKPGSKGHTFEVATTEGRVFSVTCSPVRGPGDAVQGVVVVVSDVTEARALQLQFAQSERLSALGEMISGVAHELNNPLASVIGFSQLIQDRDVDADIKKKLVAIDNQATRCQKIVQNLLRFARRHSPERRPIDLNSSIDSVLQLIGHQLEVDDIHVTLHLQRDLQPVMGDFHLLQQVFFNIVHNAYQAMKEKGGHGSLQVSTRNEDQRVIVEITDDGPGITPRNLKRIFDPFFSTKEVGKGTGLGLSLVYGTVKEHGGTIRARSRPGSGTTFTIELPAAPVDAAAPPRAAPSAAAEPAAAGTPGRRILVVEDELSLAEVVSEVLRLQGHTVDMAGDGRTAKELITQCRYDLIISDLKMPNMNGRDFYRHVASVEPALARRIIFSTGDTANPDTQSFFEEVGNPFLTKPFNLKELLRVVDLVLAQS